MDKRTISADLKKHSARARKGGLWKRSAGATERRAASTLAKAWVRRPILKGRKPVRVLVVEDEGRVRDAAVEALTRRGMIVQKASRPDGLMYTLHRFRPDVVVLDDYFRQAKVSFADLMPGLIERFPSVRYVVALGDARLPTAFDPLKWGASDVVYKDTMFQNHALELSVINAARG